MVVALSVACAIPSASTPATTSNTSRSTASVASTKDVTPTMEREVNQVAEATPLPSPTNGSSNSVSSDAVTSAKIELRAGPDSLYDLVKSLPANETLSVLGKNPGGDWYMVRSSSSDGWVKAPSVKLNVAPSAIPVAQVPPEPPAAAGSAGPSSKPTTAPATSSALSSNSSSQQVTGIGDSIMLGAASDLKKAIGLIDIDAAVGRQVTTAIDVLRARQSSAQLAPIVVVDIGNNGPVSAKQFDDMMRSLSGAKRVVFVNLKVPRDWETPNNAILADGVKRYPNTVLVDWHAASASHPELFWDDGLHLRPEGARVYADLIAKAIKTP